MKGFLADTNIPSELTRPNPDARVVAFLESIEKEQVYLSVLTLGEIRKGVASLPDGNRRRLLDAEAKLRGEGQLHLRGSGQIRE